MYTITIMADNKGYFTRARVWTNFYYLMGSLCLMLCLQYAIQVYELYFADPGLLDVVNLVATVLPYGIWMLFIWTCVVITINMVKMIGEGLKKKNEPY